MQIVSRIVFGKTSCNLFYFFLVETWKYEILKLRNDTTSISDPVNLLKCLVFNINNATLLGLKIIKSYLFENDLIIAQL